jgi:hypothetical protein
MRMRSRSSLPGRGLALVALALLVGALPGAGAEPRATAEDAAREDPSPRGDCCFTNRAFSGVCKVKPAEDETCASILAYLNNPQSQGRDYCGKTTIRGGWQQTTCEPPQTGDPIEAPPR